MRGTISCLSSWGSQELWLKDEEIPLNARQANDLPIFDVDVSSVYSSYGKYRFFTVSLAGKGASSDDLESEQLNV